MTWLQKVIRAQRHGWMPVWVSEHCIIMRKPFYHTGSRPKEIVVMFDTGRVLVVD